jgi:protoheme IX farnesyltransferase
MLHFNEWVVLAHLMIGMFLSCSGACAFNQIFEASIDARMDRTKKRPLPLKKISSFSAYIFALSLFILSSAYLYFFVNAIVAILSCITYITYLFVYTPLKRKTTLNTLVGAVPGAIPPIGGWAAATGDISSPAWILFGVLACWQIPHFLAIAIIYADDYKKGGLKMLPSVYPENKITSIYMIFFTVALTCMSLGLSIIKGYGIIFAVGALILGLIFIYFCIKLILNNSLQNAKRVFYYSIAYLPVLIILIIFS